jgi:hypothetical protein
MKKLTAVLLAFVAAGWTQNSSKPSAGTPLSSAPNLPQVSAATLVSSTRGGPAVPLPVGTPLYMTLDMALTTAATLPGDLFLAHLSRPVERDGKIIIPAGTGVEGRITSVSEPRRILGKPSLLLRPETLVLPNGQRWSVDAVVVDTNLYPTLDVNEEGAIQGNSRDSDDWKHVGAGAGGGAVIGALAGGGVGFVAGAAMGTVASTVHSLARRHSAQIPAGTELILELSRPLGPATTSPVQAAN